MKEMQRLDGWKAIAAYLGRDRTTVYRWSIDRGLPVHRLPGGKQASVYAIAAELDAWLAAARPDSSPEETPDAASPEPARSPRNRAMLAALAALAVGAVGAGALALGGIALGPRWLAADRAAVSPAASSADAAFPADPAVAAIYLAARENWSRREPAALRRAVAGFRQVIARDPGFAPAHAAEAEAWLLLREFGDATDAEAFAEAERLARKALALDPGLASAHRALGFLQYWWKQDPVAAGQSFRRAIGLSPGDAQSHFWYGNVLSDNGQAARAIHHLSRAQELQPGSLPMQVDMAWVQWEAGNDREAARRLRELDARAADNAVFRGNRADILMAMGDWQGFAREYAAYARLRGDPVTLAQARQLEASGGQGGTAIAARAVAMAMDAARQDARARPWAAMIASNAGDRASLLAVLQAARAADERWGSAGYRLRIAEQWRNDAGITALLAAVQPPPVEPERR